MSGGLREALGPGLCRGPGGPRTSAVTATVAWPPGPRLRGTAVVDSTCYGRRRRGSRLMSRSVFTSILQKLRHVTPRHFAFACPTLRAAVTRNALSHAPSHSDCICPTPCLPRSSRGLLPRKDCRRFLRQ